ncbi:DASS family sodium-coupled anion symporter [Altererythrobacter arenosus]|uniref:DASS family sodium-coupled anion symporter n=1 Tax=Altererythrobacter arenosus TaxID=3032592 RepID=A0ABY8FWY3_9SPHN|nr:DASS family sodium-coupled anion symporter [Altererythrobacter sp. CAU 1644]WFL77751.1 DASS family sodium-coupled anion symporter [Altererythrobacter sp. CAU 1644]
MTAKQTGLIVGALGLAITALTAPPAGMSAQAWIVAGLVVIMAAWWITEAVPLAVTALLPFLVLPLAGVMDAKKTASAYYSDIIFLLLGGAFLALAIERTGLHRRLAIFLLSTLARGGGQFRLLLAFMAAAAILSMAISNTSTALIMMPVALAVLAGGEHPAPDDPDWMKRGMLGALPMGIAFAASIGGLGTLVGSPTNAIAVGLIDEILGVRISFAEWTAFGLPIVLVGVPLAAWLIARVQRIADHPFDVAAARAAVESHDVWTTPERRLVPIIAITFLLWMTQALLEPFLPDGALTEGTVAVAAALALFLIPDGTGRPLLQWDEADRAPWGVLLMFGGGLALAAGMSASGFADWVGQQLLPLEVLPLIVIAAVAVALVIVVTEFASNVATASGIMPVIAALTVGLGADPLLLAMPAALAASWGFILPAGTGPNAIAWSTGRLRIEKLVSAGLALDIVGIFLIVGAVWAVAGISG